MSTMALYGYAAASVMTVMIPLWIVSVAIKDASIVDHLVELVERKAAEIEAAKSGDTAPALEPAQ